MVRHQAVGEGVGYRRDVLRIFSQKVGIVAFLYKELFGPIGVVENVVATTGLQGNFWVAHGDWVYRTSSKDGFFCHVCATNFPKVFLLSESSIAGGVIQLSESFFTFGKLDQVGQPTSIL